MNLEAWVQNWTEELAKPSVNNNNVPLCPFAKKAWQQEAVKIVECEDIWATVCQEAKNFGSHKVVMCIQEDPQYTYDELDGGCASLNQWFAYTNMDIWLLSYQIDRAIVFLQPLSELDTASVALEKLGYYKNYESDDYNRLIKLRRKLRGVQQ